MRQRSLAAEGFEKYRKKTRKEVFLEEMEREERKHLEEMDREDRKHWEETER